MMNRFLFLVVIATLISNQSGAQTNAAPATLNMNSNKPLEITADETLEWNRNNKQYIARGQAIAKQGDVEIHADILTADYEETAESNFDIYRLTAAGNVKVISRGSTATGQQAVYDVKTGVAIMTGDNLTLLSPEQTVTAEDSFEYYTAEGRLTAIGNAYVVRPQDTIRADKMSAFFAKNSAGKNEITRMTAHNNVVITTPAEKLTGDNGEYIAATEIATITGNVKIARGPNVLEGTKAEVNLKTSISKIHGGQGHNGTGRVRGIFYPGSEDSQKTQTSSPQPTQAPAATPAYDKPAVTINPLPSAQELPQRQRMTQP